MPSRPHYDTLEARAREAEAEVFGGDAVIVCDNLVKIYQQEDLEVIALQGLDLVVQQGEFIAIVGASGSGKSTLLGAMRKVVLKMMSNTMAWNPMEPFMFTVANEDYKYVNFLF